MKLLPLAFLAPLIAFCTLGDETNTAPGIVLSSTNGLVTTTAQPQQIIFVFTDPNSRVPHTDIVLEDVVRVGTNVLARQNVRVVDRTWQRVTNAIPELAIALEKLPAVMPLLMAPETNAPAGP